MYEILSVVLSLFGCLVCLSATVFLCFFFLALGKPKPLLGFGVPLVSLLPGRALRLQPVHHARHLHQGHRPALCVCVCFFFRRRRSSFRLGCYSVCPVCFEPLSLVVVLSMHM